MTNLEQYTKVTSKYNDSSISFFGLPFQINSILARVRYSVNTIKSAFYSPEACRFPGFQVIFPKIVRSWVSGAFLSA